MTNERAYLDEQPYKGSPLEKSDKLKAQVAALTASVEALTQERDELIERLLHLRERLND